MSLKSLPCFTVICDWPECGADVLADGEFSGYGDTDQLAIEVEGADWRTSLHGLCHYCPDHPVTWASDHEGGEPFPAPPYLLIHDGDTGNCADDGTVSFVGGAR